MLDRDPAPPWEAPRRWYRGGMRTSILVAMAALAHAGPDAKEWAEGVPFTTDWNAAIKEAKNTGRILFIYNGWERPDI